LRYCFDNADTGREVFISNVLTCQPVSAYTVSSNDLQSRGARMVNPETQQTVLGYLGRAWQMVDTGRLTLKHQDYITTRNRIIHL